MENTPARDAFDYRRRLDQFRAALDEHAIVAITDARGIITFVNDKFCEISQYGRDELVGRSHRMVNSGTHPPEFFHGLWTTISNGCTWKGEICNRAKGGGLYWVESTIIPFTDEQGRPCEYLAIRTDVTERKREHEELVRLLRTELHNTRKALEGILPICGFCKDIRDKDGQWTQMEEFISRHSQANFSHTICPRCMRKHYAGLDLET